MLPFLQEKLTARKLLDLFRAGLACIRMNAAEITNSTGKTLDGGPITVYDAGAYAGEALVETLKTGDKRLISYGVDLGTRITTALRFSRRRWCARFMCAAGLLDHEDRRGGDQDLHHPQRGPESQDADHRAPRPPRVQAAEPEAGREHRQSTYRFEVKLAAGATEKFP